MGGKKVWKKTGFGVLFVAACFAAMYILMEFHGKVLIVSLVAVLLLVTAFLFLNEVFSDKVKNWIPEEGAPGDFQEMVSGSSSGEFRLKISKHMKEMESTQKELIDVLKNQNVLLQSKLENMEQAMATLSEKQVNQTKSVIKFNKENARQLAISERETLEYVMLELKSAIENNAGTAGIKVAAEEAPVMEENVYAAEEPTAAPDVSLEELGSEELFEVSDLPGDDEYVIPEVPAPEKEPVADIPAEELFAIEEPEEFDLSALFEDMAAGVQEEMATEEPVAEVPAAEETPAEEPAATTPATDPLAGLGGDPNAMMTPEDIAKLLASMGQ